MLTLIRRGFKQPCPVPLARNIHQAALDMPRPFNIGHIVSVSIPSPCRCAGPAKLGDAALANQVIDIQWHAYWPWKWAQLKVL